jgi:type I restriction enzyme S subunit
MNRPVTQHKRATYPAYKPSGVAWLGEIPSIWSIEPAKRHFVIQLGKMLQNGPTCDTDRMVPYFKALHVLWGTVNANDLPEMWASPSEIKQYGVESGDLLVCEGGEVGRAGIASDPPVDSIIQNALHRVRAKNTGDVRFLMYVLHSVSSGGWFDVLCNRATIAHFTGEKFAALRIPLPTADEQQAIAAFLDRETARIDTLIEKKRRQIELLQEKRSALISHAVTKGLDPNAKMKDSGIEWLGEIPEHWEVLAFKRLGDFQAGAGFPNDDQGLDDDELPFYKVSDTNLPGNKMFMNFHNNAVSRETALRLRAYVFPQDTIIFAKVGAALLLNKRRILIRPSCIDNNMMGFVPKSCNRNWAYYWMCTLDLGGIVNPGAVPSINEGQIREIRVPVPSIDEQRAIAAFLDRETARNDALIEKVEKSIELLREYRTALISGAVTGKIDVRKEVV